MANFPLYRWLCRRDCLWLDTVTTVEAEEPAFICRIWPGQKWEGDIPLFHAGLALLRIALGDLHRFRESDDEKFRRWQGEGIHVIYIHPAISEYSYMRLYFPDTEVMLDPPSLWRLLLATIEERLDGNVIPTNFDRHSVNPILEATEEDLQVAEAERRARKTAKFLLGDKLYKRYLKNGYVSVQAKSGRVYNIPGGLHHALVYEKGVLVDSVCLQLPSDYCDTDQLIFRWIHIQNDEQSYLEKAQHHPISGAIERAIKRKKEHLDRTGLPPLRPLTEMAAEIKSAVHGSLKTVQQAIVEVKEMNRLIDEAQAKLDEAKLDVRLVVTNPVATPEPTVRDLIEQPGQLTQELVASGHYTTGEAQNLERQFSACTE